MKGHTSDHNDCYLDGTLLFSQLTATYLKMGTPWMTSTGARSSNGLRWRHLKIGHQYSIRSNSRQGETYFITIKRGTPSFAETVLSLMGALETH